MLLTPFSGKSGCTIEKNALSLKTKNSDALITKSKHIFYSSFMKTSRFVLKSNDAL